MSEFDDLLNYDALGHAQELTGQDYKSDHDTTMLGMALQIEHARSLRDELSLRGDTYYGINYLDYLQILDDAGFQSVYSTTFPERDGRISQFHLHWRDGILISSDSYRGIRLNDSTVYGCYEFHNKRGVPQGFSGGFDLDLYDEGRYVFNGSFHGVHGFLHRLHSAEAEGTFLPEWVNGGPRIYVSDREMMGVCRDLGIELPETRFGAHDLRKYLDRILPEDVYAAIGVEN